MRSPMTEHSTWPFALYRPEYPADSTAFTTVLSSLRGLLDAVANASPPAALSLELKNDLDRWQEALRSHAVAESDAPYGQLHEARDHGLTVVPEMEFDIDDPEHVEATVTFGRWHVGGGGTAHGGQVATAFDALMGRSQLNAGRIARTAFLNVTYRAGTPLNVPLRIVIRSTAQTDRKHTVRGHLYDGARLLAEAEALFVRVARYPASSTEASA